MVTHYVGILDGTGDAWGVRVPDLPGVHGGGVTAKAAISDAISAAREWAASETRKGYAIAAARTVDAVLKSGEVQDGEATVLIPLLPE